VTTTPFAEFDRLAREGDLTPVVRELSGDTETPISAFLKLGARKESFLLESAHPGESWGRYSYLGDRPLAVIRQHQDHTEIEEAGTLARHPHDGPPLEPLRALLRRRKMARSPGLPRFAGGLVGYLGWGAARWFEPRLPQRRGPDPAFPVGEWMLAGRLIVFDNHTHAMKLIACADLAAQHADAAYRTALAELDALEETLRRPVPFARRPRIGEWRDHAPRAAFEASVARVKDYVAAGDCFQCVMSRRMTAAIEGDPFEVYRALRRVSPTPYLYFLQFGDRALAGASPELLVRVDGGRATLRPIAGTRPRGVTPDEDVRLEAELKADEKERAEHVMLVDLGRNDLGRVSAAGTVRVEEFKTVERYSHVMHLVSQVSGELRPGVDAFDVIAAVFPAGTVSGAPKVRAMEIIDELESEPRGPYGGAAGYVGWDGSCDLAISIRTVAIADGEIRVQAGAGVVHDSSPALEFDETEHKLGAPRRALEALR
jgi:anthranilate synthase component 1